MRDRILYIALGVCSFLVLGIALYFCRFGLDYTDESFYIHWVTAPDAYAIHVPLTFFGYIYHPLFSFVDGNLALLRQINMALIFGLAGILSYLTMRRQLDFEAVPAAVFSLALAAVSLACFRVWAVSPNYNTLAFEGLMIALTGLVLSDSKDRRVLFATWSLVAIGGWLAFMGKPTTAALLGPAVVAYLVITRYRPWAFAVWAGVLAGILTVGSLLAIDHGSINAVVARVTHSLEAVRLLRSGQTIDTVFRIDGPDLDILDWLMIIAGCVAAAIFSRWSIEGRHARGQDIFCLAAIACAALVIATGIAPIDFDGVEQIGFAVAALAACLWLRRKRIAIIVWRRDLLALGALFFFAPYFYAFGTNGNYWDAGAEVCVFWGLAAIVFMWPIVQTQAGIRAVLPLVSVILLFGVLQLNNGIVHPFRQPEPLRAMTATVPVAGGVITKAQSFAAYDQAVHDIAAAGGFTPGTPVIDLTGRSPGVLYNLKAQALGQPWLVGRYDGSNEFAIYTLAAEDCADIAKAWLLAEPEGPRHLDGRRVMAASGADINTDFAKTADVLTPEWAGGYKEPYAQYFLKPTRPYDVALNACLKARAKTEESETSQ